MADPQPSVRVPALSRRLEGRVTGANTTEEDTVSGRLVTADLVATRSNHSREETAIAATAVFSAASSEEEHREGSRLVEEESDES